MSVKNAVERREQAPAKASPKAIAEQRIQGQLPTFTDVLPKDFDADRFMRLTLVAIKDNAKLLGCFATTTGTQALVLASIQAAALGLEPNTPLGDCWIQPRREKQGDQWIDSAELSISYRGLSKLALQHHDVAGIVADVVRDGDHFIHERGLHGDILEHRPGRQRGELTHAYAILRLRSGGADYVVLDRDDVERARASSGSADKASSPWQKHEATMWRKTAIKRLCTSTPYRTVALAQAVSVDERQLVLDGGTIISVDADEVPAELPQPAPAIDLAPTPPPAEDEAVRAVPADPETGELFAHDNIPWAWDGWDRDAWAAWGRDNRVQLPDVRHATRLQSWADVASAPDTVKERVYALARPAPDDEDLGADGEPF